MKKTLILTSMLLAFSTGCTHKTIGVSDNMTFDATNVDMNNLKKGTFCDSDAKDGQVPTVGLAALKGSISTVNVIDQEYNSDNGRCVVVYGK